MTSLPALLALFAIAPPAAEAGAEAPKPPLQVSSVADRALAGQPGDSLLLIVGDRIMVARVDQAGISSRIFRLRLEGTQLRGKVAGQSVMLDLGERRIEGHIGASAVALDVSRGKAGIEVSGRFGTYGITQSLSPAIVTAEVGPCRYDLTFKGKEYVGRVDCGGQSVGVQLRVAAALVARGDVELAALFTAMLAR
jgi:hypothetical protein